MKLHRKWFGLAHRHGARHPERERRAHRTRPSPSRPCRAPRPRVSRPWRRCTKRRPASSSRSSSRRTRTSTRSSSRPFETNDATYDLVMLDDPWMPKFGTMGALTDLGAAGHRARIPTSPRSSGTSGPGRPRTARSRPRRSDKPPQLLGVTVVGNVEMFMYRCDITPEPPASYDDVLARAQEQNTADFAGYIIRGQGDQSRGRGLPAHPVVVRRATSSTRTGTSSSTAPSRWLP